MSSSPRDPYTKPILKNNTTYKVVQNVNARIELNYRTGLDTGKETYL